MPTGGATVWVGGIASEVSDEALESCLEEIRRKATSTHNREFGGFHIRRIAESAGAWVEFAQPVLAQETIALLNGSLIGPSTVVVRYARLGELTAGPDQGSCRNLWIRQGQGSGGPPVPWSSMPAATSNAAASEGSSGTADVSAAGGAAPAAAPAQQPVTLMPPPPPPPPPAQARLLS